jgi:hypothetical protein
MAFARTRRRAASRISAKNWAGERSGEFTSPYTPGGAVRKVAKAAAVSLDDLPELDLKT